MVSNEAAIVVLLGATSTKMLVILDEVGGELSVRVSHAQPSKQKNGIMLAPGKSAR
jgi:hypothetical protein